MRRIQKFGFCSFFPLEIRIFGYIRMSRYKEKFCGAQGRSSWSRCWGSMLMCSMPTIQSLSCVPPVDDGISMLCGTDPYWNRVQSVFLDQQEEKFSKWPAAQNIENINNQLKVNKQLTTSEILIFIPNIFALIFFSVRSFSRANCVKVNNQLEIKEQLTI